MLQVRNAAFRLQFVQLADRVDARPHRLSQGLVRKKYHPQAASL